MHRTSVAAAVALAVVAPLTACAERKSEARPSPMPSSASPTPQPLTPRDAEREFAAYTANDEVARAAGDERLALSWVADGQALLTAAEYRKAAFDGDPVKRYEYGKPRLYVPKLPQATYPQWFVAETARTVRGQGKSTRTALMAFVRRSAAEDWKLSLTTELMPKAKVPKIRLDAEGYAPHLSNTDGSVLIRPREVPGIQATLAQEGPASVVSKIMKSGPVTTGYYQQTERAEKRAKDRGLNLQAVFVATQFPIFALRTEHQDALVLYSLSRNSVTSVKDREHKPPIPPEVAHLLDGTVKGTDINTAETLQFAAVDPVRAKSGKDQPKADVIANAGAVTKASTPPPKNP
ncbi:hypothetical protein ACIBF1_24655 [Spirillospora sp. NPDC050679]